MTFKKGQPRPARTTEVQEFEFKTPVPGMDFEVISKVAGSRSGYTFFQHIERTPAQIIRENTTESDFLIAEWNRYMRKNRDRAREYERTKRIAAYTTDEEAKECPKADGSEISLSDVA